MRMMFKMCAGFAGAVLLLGAICLVLLSHWAVEPPLLTGPVTEEELMDMRDAMIAPAAAKGNVPPGLNTNQTDRS